MAQMPAKMPAHTQASDTLGASLLMHSVSKRLKRGAGIALILQIVSALLGLGVNVILARALGIESYGAYSFLFAAASFAALFGRFGIDSAMLRFMPEYVVTSRAGYIRGLMRIGLLSGILVSGTIALILFVFFGFFYHSNTVTYGLVAVGLSAAMVPGMALLAIGQKALRSFGSITKALIGDYVLRPGIISLAILIMWLILHSQISLENALFITLGAIVFVVVSQQYWLGRNSCVKDSSLESVRYELRRWISVSFPMFGTAALTMILSRADIIIVGIFRSNTEVAFYNAATRIALLMTFGLTALNTIGAPMISQLYADGKFSSMRDLLTNIVRAGGIFGAIIAFLIVGLSHWIFMIFGQGFQAAFLPLIILMIGQFINVAVGPVALLLNMTDRHNAAFFILLCGAILNLSIGIVGTYYYGVIGAAVGTSLAMIVWNLSMVIFARRQYGWWIIPFYGVLHNDRRTQFI